MKILFTTACKPIPILAGKFLSMDQASFRFVADQGLFSISSTAHSFALHFLAQNINVPSVVLEWPTLDELAKELESETYDYVGISFRSIDIDRLPDMINLIRLVSPDTKIIIGGYGTLGLEELEEEGIHIRDKVDYVCQGEGVAYLKAILGDNEQRPMISHLPLETYTIPWLSQSGIFPPKKVGYILSALGCPVKCEFCATSAYTGGELVEVMTADEIYESMKWYHENYRSFDQAFIMDENFLDYKEKVNELGRLIRNDERFGLSKMNYVAFGTALAVSEWELDELLLNGVSDIWIGIESFFSYDNKKVNNIKTLIHRLHEHGLRTTLSWIIGDDCQTKDNIDEDIEQFIALKSPASQLSLLIANRGTQLSKRLKREGRAKPFRAEDMHLFGNSMDALHFSHQERFDIVMNMYRKIYETNGPSIMRVTKIDMNGYRHCLHSKNPYLNGPKLEYFKRKVRNSIPLVKTAIEFAPNSAVKNLMEDLEAEYVELFGPFTKSQQIAADYMLSLAEKEYKRRELEGYSTLRDIPLERYTYPGRKSGVEVSTSPGMDISSHSVAKS